jgi:hypothetical protein
MRMRMRPHAEGRLHAESRLYASRPTPTWMRPIWVMAAEGPAWLTSLAWAGACAARTAAVPASPGPARSATALAAFAAVAKLMAQSSAEGGGVGAGRGGRSVGASFCGAERWARERLRGPMQALPLLLKGAWRLVRHFAYAFTVKGAV